MHRVIFELWKGGPCPEDLKKRGLTQEELQAMMKGLAFISVSTARLYPRWWSPAHATSASWPALRISTATSISAPTDTEQTGYGWSTGYLSEGPPLAVPSPLSPATEQCSFPEGTVVRCAPDGGVYLIEGGRRRHYPIPQGHAATPNRPPDINLDDCTRINACPFGADVMP